LNESASFGEPAIAARGPFRQAIIDLSREIGFVANRDDSAAPAATQPGAINGLFKMLRLQKG